MTETNIQYLDMAGLQVYDELIKGVISKGDAKFFSLMHLQELLNSLKQKQLVQHLIFQWYFLSRT